MEFARRVQEICARYDFAYYGNWGLILAGWCAGGPRAPTRSARAWAACATRARWPASRTTWACWRRPCWLAGQPDAAGAVLESARVAAAIHDDRWWLPELYRLDARRHRGAAAAALLRQAVGPSPSSRAPWRWSAAPPPTWPSEGSRPRRMANGPRTPRPRSVLATPRRCGGRPSSGEHR